MKSGLAFLAIASAALMTGAAEAQDDDAALGSVYVRAGAGYTFVNNWDQDFTYNPDAVFVMPPPTGQTIENGDGVIFTGALGFDYADGIRTELEYRYAATEFDSVTLFIGGGVGGAFMENENGQRDAALALQARAGVSYELSSGFLADVEYVYLRTNELSFGPDIDDFEPSGPVGPNIGDDRYQASSVMMSLRKHF